MALEMHGGVKAYAGAPAAARAYLEADRGRADDYYLAEGTGLARRFTATAGRVEELAPLTGETYESWVAGRDPDTGQPRGRLRTDERAVRFVEVVVNGPKSWSLAAAVHPDVAAAYDAAQDRAAVEIIGWLAGHATTRIGPRGGQVQVPLEALEAATVRHYTSRAGDPHRHLHLQLNARVFAAEQWRGLHPVGVRDFLAPSTESDTPQSPATRSSAARWPPTATRLMRLEKYWSSPSTSVRSARGRGRSGAMWIATNATGWPRTPANLPGRRCGRRGMPERGPTVARTRSSPARGPT